jgi:hypothetical protein
MRLPPLLTKETLFKAFIELTKDRYPSAEKVLRLSRPLGIDGNIALQIIVFGAMRDMVRQVSREYMYRSTEHRDQIYNALISALEELEDKFEAAEDEKLQADLEAAKQADNRPDTKS